MKLHYSPSSPFVRKALVCAHERGLADRIELTSPATMFNGELRADNPLEKVPTLVLDDGTALYDSFVIAAHFADLGAGPELIPEHGAGRVAVLRRHALANGMMDAAVACVMETRRPEGKIWPDFPERQKGKIARGADALESQAEAMGDTVDLSTISAACALGYVDFRMGDLDWRVGRPGLTAWYAAFSRRPSMIATEPRDPPAS